jgi:hypothetical protein
MNFATESACAQHQVDPGNKSEDNQVSLVWLKASNLPLFIPDYTDTPCPPNHPITFPKNRKGSLANQITSQYLAHGTLVLSVPSKYHFNFQEYLMQ